MTRRGFVAAASATALGGCGRAASPVSGFELDEISLADIGAGLRDGRWTTRRLVELYLARIEAVDHNGPKLGSVIEVNPDAIALAKTLDQERKDKHIRGPLHGIP